MATYAEFLKSQGATDDEVKILDTPVARKAYDKMQAATADAEAARKKADDLYKANQDWHQQVEEQNQRLAKERDSALTAAAAESAKVKKLQELGLIELAESTDPGSTRPTAGETPAFDPKLLDKYVDRDTLLQVAEREGDAIAAFADISAEHRELFPDQKISFRELRREAVQRKMTVEGLWMEKYNVSARRAEVAAATKAKYESELIAKGRKEAETELASKYANPLTTPPVASNSPFTKRPSDAPDASALPWNRSDASKSQDRLNKVMSKINAPVN